MEEIRFNLAAPDLLCICVDDRQHGDSSGRVYCCYSREAMYFAHEYQLIKKNRKTSGPHRLSPVFGEDP